MYAHTKNDKSNLQKELLLSHMELTYAYYLQMEEYKNLEKILYHIVEDLTTMNKISEAAKEKTIALFRAAIYYHDIGKINPNFQRIQMQNDSYEKASGTTEHSLLSARIYLDAFKRQIYEEMLAEKYSKKDAKFLQYIIYYFSYVISRHHSSLTDLNDYLTKLSIVDVSNVYETKFAESETNSDYMNEKLKKFLAVFGIDEILLYLLNELLYSCLVTADFLATSAFMTGSDITIKRDKKADLFVNYENSELYCNMNQYKQNKLALNGINQLRSDMFIESQENMDNNLDKVIYYLEAPTGSGKTNMAINLARILYHQNTEITSINYIFPFNTLIDQTKNTLAQYFIEYEDFIVINSCTAIVDEKNEILNDELAYIKSEFRQYDIKLTSHVNLFDTLFGTSKSGKYNLYDLANSVIVLDEIQSYTNKIWRDMITLLVKFATYLHIKIIIMSATLPKLDKLLDDSVSKDVCSLIQNKKKYFENVLFKERVKLDFSLLEDNNILDTLKEKIKYYKDKKILIEFISKKSASLFYHMLKEEGYQNVYELTGDDNAYTRQQIIEQTRQKDPMILIATQTIEAGVDIDMDIGFKDISYLDNEEQFLGRINRSAKNSGCIAYFFYLDDEDKIYRNDYRSDFTIREESIRDILNSKDFDHYYGLVMDKIYRNTEKYNSNNAKNLYLYCGDLNFKGISERLKLIDTNTIQIFLNYTITINGEALVGKEVWEEYKNIMTDNSISYAKKQIELSKIKPRLNLFLYQIYKNKKGDMNYYDEAFGNIYYIQNGDEFMEDGKFNREKYSSYTRGMFL